MKVYHYISLKDWKNVKNGSWQSADKPGLSMNRIGRVNKEASETAAIFALLDPMPNEWVDNKKYPDIWGYLKRDVGSLLLEINIKEDDLNIYVIDRGYMENFLYKEGANDDNEGREIAENNYVKSKIRLSEYLKNKDKLKFILPEIIFTEKIPFEKISISKEQPLLEEEFMENIPKTATELIKLRERDKSTIRREIPELSEWYTKFFKEPYYQEKDQKIRFK